MQGKWVKIHTNGCFCERLQAHQKKDMNNHSYVFHDGVWSINFPVQVGNESSSAGPMAAG